jgi:hypothetical protein
VHARCDDDRRRVEADVDGARRRMRYRFRGAMQRPPLLGVLVVLFGAAALWFVTQRSPPAPAATPAAAPAARAQHAAENGEAGPATVRSIAVDGGATPVSLDPEIRAGLVGFAGRVVDGERRPVAGCGVRIERGAWDMLAQQPDDAPGGRSTDAARFAAGECTTGSDARFRLDGVWPRGWYLLSAGIGTGAPSHRLIAQAPAPGTVVDLGDVVLDATAVVTGRVVDEAGQPVAGALIRGVDLPGSVLASFPFERVDPAGCLLLRDQDGAGRVLEFPAWVQAAFARLPLAAAISDRDGAFRLAGLVPGDNTIVATAPGFVPCVAPGLQVGALLDLGTTTLRRGESLAGRVVDAAGLPVAGAEVVAGSTAGGSIDAARRIGASDAAGRFAADGFGPGLVTVAARRSARDPWVLAAPQPIGQDVVVGMPAAHALTVRVTDAAGAIVGAAEVALQVEVLAGAGNDASILALFGRPGPVALDGRTTVLADGRLRIDDLPERPYSVQATADGVTGRGVVLLAADAELAIALPARGELCVRVLGPEEVPVRGAAIYVQELDGRAAPFLAGRTEGDGRLRTRSGCSEATVSAEHPRWGCVHGHAARGEGELVLRMQPPGWIEGTVLDHGQTPAPGSCTVRAQYDPDVRGPVASVPILVAPRADGTFSVPGMQPGRYRVGVSRSMAGGRGALTGLAQAALPSDELSARDVLVVSGQGARIDLDPGQLAAPVASARLAGAVRIDGRLAAAGTMVALWAPGGRRVVGVDGAGRFDFGQVPAAGVQVRVLDGSDAETARALWEQHLLLQPGEVRELSIEFATAAMRGSVVLPDGAPAAGVDVQACARGLDRLADDGGVSWHATRTDERGAFAFERVPAGIYRLAAYVGGNPGLRGALVDVRADGSGPVAGLRIQLQPAVVVAGRVDISGFARKPDFVGLAFWTVDPEHLERRRKQVAWEVVQDDGSFTTEDLEPGTYSLQIHVRLDGWQQCDASERIEVPPAGVRGLVVRPLRKQ